MTGQNRGARQPQRAVRTAWLATGILEAFYVACAVVVLVWAENIVLLFNNDPALVGISATFLRIAAISYLVMSINTAMMNCIGGAGDTLPNMIINIGMVWLVQLPLAYILSNYTWLDVSGVRWGMVASNLAAAVATFAYFQSGRWKRKAV